jgi:hypothetical protein
MISGALLLSLLVSLVIGGLILWLFWWFIGYIGLPEPFNKVAHVIIGLVALIWMVNLLLSLGGAPLFRFGH